MGAVRQAAEAGVVGLVCVGTDAETSRQAVSPGGRDPSCGGGRAGPGIPAGFGAWATVGLHPHDAAQGLADVEGALDEALARTRGRWWRWGSADSTTTTTIRPAPPNATCSPPRSTWPRNGIWPSSFTPVTPGTTPSTSCTAPIDPSMWWCTVSPADPTRPVGVSISMPIFRSAASSPSRPPTTSAAAAALCPLDRLLVETDAPFLAPVPHRGEDNRPALVSVVGDAVATVKKVTADAVAASSAAAARARLRPLLAPALSSRRTSPPLRRRTAPVVLVLPEWRRIFLLRISHRWSHFGPEIRSFPGVFHRRILDVRRIGGGLVTLCDAGLRCSPGRVWPSPLAGMAPAIRFVGSLSVP